MLDDVPYSDCALNSPSQAIYDLQTGQNSVPLDEVPAKSELNAVNKEQMSSLYSHICFQVLILIFFFIPSATEVLLMVKFMWLSSSY